MILPRSLGDVTALIGALLVSGIIVAYPLFDYDLYWHLANGREMVARGRIINEDVFSYTKAGTSFSNHEWLSQVILYFVYDHWGALGLNAFKIFISLAIAFMIFMTSRWLGANPVLSATICCSAILVGIYRYNVRPELFSLLFVAALNWILHGYRIGMFQRRALYVIPPIMLVWDWLHGAVFGVVVLSAFAVGEITKRFVGSRYYSAAGLQPMPEARLKSLYVVLAITLGIMILNPYGIRSYDIFLEFVGENALVPEVNEFQPPTLANYFSFFFALAVCVIVLLARWRAADLSGVLVATPFIYLAFVYSRVTGVAALVLVPLIATLLGTRGSKLTYPLLARGGTIAVAIILIVYISNVKFARSDWNYSFGLSELDDYNPIGSTRFVIANNLRGNLYNSGNIGGYLSFHITPERKIFQYNHHTVFGNTVRFINAPKELEQWNINYGIISLRNEMKYVFPRTEWARVYLEPSAAVVVRRSEQNRELISKYELRYFHPGLSHEKLATMARDPGARDRLVEEMAYYLAYRSDKRICDLLGSILYSSVPVSTPTLSAINKLLLNGPSHNSCLVDAGFLSSP